MTINREEAIEELVEQLTDNADMDSLIHVFREQQIDWAEDMTDEELMEQYEYYMNEPLIIEKE